MPQEKKSPGAKRGCCSYRRYSFTAHFRNLLRIIALSIYYPQSTSKRLCLNKKAMLNEKARCVIFATVYFHRFTNAIAPGG
jgi:hypothetical protein